MLARGPNAHAPIWPLEPRVIWELVEKTVCLTSGAGRSRVDRTVTPRITAKSTQVNGNDAAALGKAFSARQNCSKEPSVFGWFKDRFIIGGRNGYKVAVVGATGNVGREMLNILQNASFL